MANIFSEPHLAIFIMVLFSFRFKLLCIKMQVAFPLWFGFSYPDNHKNILIIFFLKVHFSHLNIWFTRNKFGVQCKVGPPCFHCVALWPISTPTLHEHSEMDHECLKSVRMISSPLSEWLTEEFEYNQGLHLLAHIIPLTTRKWFSWSNQSKTHNFCSMGKRSEPFSRSPDMNKSPSLTYQFLQLPTLWPQRMPVKEKDDMEKIKAE